MSTTTRTSRGKPVTLAKSAATDVSAPKATKSAAKAAAAPKAATPKAKAEVAAAPVNAETVATPPVGVLDEAFHAKWNDLMKAQSDAALAWWQEVKDARTVADAIAVNARHSRLQFEMAAGQAREMATFFQKTLEGNAERIRAMLTPGHH